jgi:hypothetical protein
MKQYQDDVTYAMYNVVCRSMAIEAMYAASGRGSSPH